MTGPQFRPAEAADLEAIMELENRVFASDAWSREAMAGELSSPHTTYIVAVDDDAAVIAYAGLLAPSGSTDADIQTIAVAADVRRRGLGRALMLRLMDVARERGAAALFLEVRADNSSARRLYSSLGFEAIGVRPRYYQPGDVDATVMRASLPVTQPEVMA